MGFIKNALIGIAVYETVNYLMTPDELGRTKIDEIKEKAPEWVEKARAIKEDIQNIKMPV